MGHIFISYSHKDTTYAHGLADQLRNMGFDAWMDERLDYGSDSVFLYCINCTD